MRFGRDPHAFLEFGPAVSRNLRRPLRLGALRFGILTPSWRTAFAPTETRETALSMTCRRHSTRLSH
jgi:hypothetical protein